MFSNRLLLASSQWNLVTLLCGCNYIVSPIYGPAPSHQEVTEEVIKDLRALISSLDDFHHNSPLLVQRGHMIYIAMCKELI